MLCRRSLVSALYYRRALGSRDRRIRGCSSIVKDETKVLKILNREFVKDEWTNLTPGIINHLDKKLHLKKDHPLGILRRRIVEYIYKRFTNNRGNPLFSIHDTLSPIVTLEQNFDTLLVPKDHPSRKRSDSYYINSEYMLRAHTSAHQSELISMGLDNFLVIGDVYRRDAIDASHYPAFHQVEGVRLLSKLPEVETLFEDGSRTKEKQAFHTLDASKIMEIELKDVLLGLAQDLFGKDIEYKWVDCYFPFTHPSWELEILYKGKWMEVLGCGVMEQEILYNSGAENKIGWAFGLGLERWAMKLYQIPDIRLFWSTDPGFTKQFITDGDINKPIIYKEVSKFPPCYNDISFWLPQDSAYSENDFYDLVRTVGGDVVEQVDLIDEFVHPKHKKTSHCYRIRYRHMEKTLTQEEANEIHSAIESEAKKLLHVTIR